MAGERFSLKDHLFNAEKIAYLGGLLEDAIDGFDRHAFETSVLSRLGELELKQRIAHIAEVLTDHLDPDFATAAAQIARALPPPLDPNRTDDDFGDFIFAPLGKYVEDHGTGAYETSIAVLKELTMRFSMEGSVRPFINQEPEATLRIFEDWARDDNYHVRRLVSESTRPTLPWAPRIALDIRAPLPLLDILHADPTRYVTRSVANHVNDISKIEPELAVETLGKWHEAGSQRPRELNWLTRHALRSLIKRGNRRALEFLGYSPEPRVVVDSVEIVSPVVKDGESLEFAATIKASDHEKLIVDYVIDFVKKNGSTSPKVFKLKTISLAAGDSLKVTKRHPLRADATTYSLNPGTHRLTIMVNGRPMATSAFEVEV